MQSHQVFLSRWLTGSEQERRRRPRSVVRHGLVAALIVSGLLSFLGVSISGQLPAWLGGEPGIRKRRHAVLFRVCPDASFFPAQFPVILLFAVQRRYGDSQYLECGDVSSGCGFQRDSDSTLWRSGSRYGNGPGLRGDQSHHDLALLHPQSAASAAPCEERRPILTGKF